MSPELLEGAMEFTNFAFQQIDVYAAGLVLWEILTRCCINENTNSGSLYLFFVCLNLVLFPETLGAFLLPFEREVGPCPSLVDMRELVIVNAFRPIINPEYSTNEVIIFVCLKKGQKIIF